MSKQNLLTCEMRTALMEMVKAAQKASASEYSGRPLEKFVIERVEWGNFEESDGSKWPCLVNFMSRLFIYSPKVDGPLMIGRCLMGKLDGRWSLGRVDIAFNFGHGEPDKTAMHVWQFDCDVRTSGVWTKEVRFK